MYRQSSGGIRRLSVLQLGFRSRHANLVAAYHADDS